MISIFKTNLVEFVFQILTIFCWTSLTFVFVANYSIWPPYNCFVYVNVCNVCYLNAVYLSHRMRNDRVDLFCVISTCWYFGKSYFLLRCINVVCKMCSEECSASVCMHRESTHTHTHTHTYTSYTSHPHHIFSISVHRDTRNSIVYTNRMWLYMCNSQIYIILFTYRMQVSRLQRANPHINRNPGEFEPGTIFIHAL